MRDKAISFILWLVIWWVIVYWYWYFVNKDTNQLNDLNRWNRFSRGNFNPSSMSDEQLQKMADRAWITLEELKNKLKSWENIRDLMPSRRWSENGTTRWWDFRWNSWSSMNQ